jgi:peptidyl-prolyl cis-trans isomerase SurA
MIIPDRRSFVLLIFVAGFVAGACRSTPAPPASPPPVSADVWASVDGREIRRDAVEKTYRRMAQPNQASSDEETLAAKLNILDRMITEDILLAKARELKIEVPTSDLDAAFNEGKKNIPDDAFNKELAARNLTAADMRDSTGRDLTIQKLIEREVTSKISVTDQDVDAFFQANKAQFNLKEDAYHIAQIVVTPGRDAGVNNRTGDDATTPQAAAAKAKMLMERLKAGAPFNEVAMDYSEDPQSAAQGGDVGLVPVSALQQAPPPLRDAVLKAKPGTVNVVTMEGGYTIVALVARQSAGQRDLSTPEVRDGIMSTLRGRREQLLREAYIEVARTNAKVVNHLARRLVDSAAMPPSVLAPLAPK